MSPPLRSENSAEGNIRAPNNRPIITEDEKELLAAIALDLWLRGEGGLHTRSSPTSSQSGVIYGSGEVTFLDLGPWPDNPGVRIGAVIESETILNPEHTRLMREVFRSFFEPARANEYRRRAQEVGSKIHVPTKVRIYPVGGPSGSFKDPEMVLDQHQQKYKESSVCEIVYSAMQLAPLTGTADRVIDFWTEASYNKGVWAATKEHGAGLGVSFVGDVFVGLKGYSYALKGYSYAPTSLAARITPEINNPVSQRLLTQIERNILSRPNESLVFASESAWARQQLAQFGGNAQALTRYENGVVTVILPSRQVSRATLFEELRHLGQFRAGIRANSSSGLLGTRLQAEWDAHVYLYRLYRANQINGLEMMRACDGMRLEIFAGTGQNLSRQEILQLLERLAGQ